MQEKVNLTSPLLSKDDPIFDSLSHKLGHRMDEVGHRIHQGLLRVSMWQNDSKALDSKALISVIYIFVFFMLRIPPLGCFIIWLLSTGVWRTSQGELWTASSALCTSLPGTNLTVDVMCSMDNRIALVGCKVYYHSHLCMMKHCVWVIFSVMAAPSTSF